MSNLIPAGRLADILNARDNPWEPLLMIDARSYFDDSGTHRQSVVTIIGGYVATKTVWEQMEEPWRAVLNEFKDKGVHCFHAKDCLSQTGQFERLQGWECHYVYKQLTDILEKSKAQSIYTAVLTEDWEAITNINFKQVYQSAYDFCIDRIIHEVVNWSANNAGGSKVPIMIAIQKEHEEETRRTFDSWARVKVISDKIGALAFEYPDSLIPLQAADMLAHEAYRHLCWVHAMDNGLNPPPKRLHPRVLDKIMRGRRLKGGHFDRWFLEVVANGIRSVDSG